MAWSSISLYAVLSVFWSLLIGRRMRFGLSCLQMRLKANHTLLRPSIFPTPQGFLPSGVMKTCSLVLTDSTVQYWQSELTLGALGLEAEWLNSGSQVLDSFFPHISKETMRQIQPRQNGK